MKYFIASAFDFLLSLTRKLITLAVISAMIFPDVARAVKPGETTADSTRPSIVVVPRKSPSSKSRGLGGGKSPTADHLRTPSSHEHRSPHGLATTPPESKAITVDSPSSPDDSESTHSSSLEDTPPNTKESVGASKPVAATRSISSTTPRTVLVRRASSTSLHLGDALNLLHESSAVELTIFRAAGTGLGDGAPVGQEKVAPGHSSESKEEANAFAAEGKTYVGVTGNVYVKVQDEDEAGAGDTGTGHMPPADARENAATGRSWVPAWVHYVVSAIAGVCSRSSHAEALTEEPTEKVDVRLKALHIIDDNPLSNNGDSMTIALLDGQDSEDAHDNNGAPTSVLPLDPTNEVDKKAMAALSAIATVTHNIAPLWQKIVIPIAALMIGIGVGVGMSPIFTGDLFKFWPDDGDAFIQNVSATNALMTGVILLFGGDSIFRTDRILKELSESSLEKFGIPKSTSRRVLEELTIIPAILAAILYPLLLVFIEMENLEFNEQFADDDYYKSPRPYIIYASLAGLALLVDGLLWNMYNIQEQIKQNTAMRTERSFEKINLPIRGSVLHQYEALEHFAEKAYGPVIQSIYNQLFSSQPKIHKVAEGMRILGILEDTYQNQYTPDARLSLHIEEELKKAPAKMKIAQSVGWLTALLAAVGRSVVFYSIMKEALGYMGLEDNLAADILISGFIGGVLAAGTQGISEFNAAEKWTFERLTHKCSVSQSIFQGVISIAAAAASIPYFAAGQEDMSSWGTGAAISAIVPFVGADFLAGLKGFLESYGEDLPQALKWFFSIENLSLCGFQIPFFGRLYPRSVTYQRNEILRVIRKTSKFLKLMAPEVMTRLYGSAKTPDP